MLQVYNSVFIQVLQVYNSGAVSRKLSDPTVGLSERLRWVSFHITCRVAAAPRSPSSTLGSVIALRICGDQTRSFR